VSKSIGFCVWFQELHSLGITFLVRKPRQHKAWQRTEEERHRNLHRITEGLEKKVLVLITSNRAGKTNRYPLDAKKHPLSHTY